MYYLDSIIEYTPKNDQEAVDRDFFLRFAAENKDCLSRANDIAHFTASAWIINQSATKVLLVWHNTYKSWTWTGGHADEDPNLDLVAIREAKEETGLQKIKMIKKLPVSLETISVDGHIKNGVYLHSHLHLNLTYLLMADDEDSLHNKPDENSGVKWFSRDSALTYCTEPWMVNNIYKKLTSFDLL